MNNTKAYLGLDVGSASVKIAALVPVQLADEVLAVEGAQQCLRETRPQKPNKAAANEQMTVLVGRYRRTRGRPIDALRESLVEFFKYVDPKHLASAALTGTGGDNLAETLGVVRFNGFQTVTRAVDLLCPDVRTVLELGGETSKFLSLVPEAGTGRLGIVNYSTNGDCAAGTGSFLDQQAGRLKYAVEDLGDIVEKAERSAQIAGRCSVFAKSDMIHAQQKGFTPPEVLRGLCDAVATNYRSAVVKGHKLESNIAFVGGVSANRAVVRSLERVFELGEGELVVPDCADSYGAIGAAILAMEKDDSGKPGFDLLQRIDAKDQRRGHSLDSSKPLNLDRVTLLRDKVKLYAFPEDGSLIDAYIGLDIGSVGTKLVVIDQDGNVVHEIFTRTQGRPIEVVTRCMMEVEQAVGRYIRVRGVGTTGSGRELIGELVGADSINDEITAHKTGATFVGDRLLGKRPDTIFEIGGQDSKYISLESEGDGSGDTVVVDFTMNEACAAGTGSFLEERAEELGVSIKGEFSRLALAAKTPVKLGERCTVFMEKDVNTCMQRGADQGDIIAGLAYSVAYNYINRVVRGRHIGDCIFFQGGTAFNDSVAAAFSMICKKQIIVPPHNAVLGAIGAALLAREKAIATGSQSRFRGYDLTKVDYTLREFTCKGCGNQCSVQEFRVGEEKTYWGDKCSDRFRKRAKTEKKAIIPDLVALREKLIAADDSDDPDGAAMTIGIPLAMYAWDQLPFWRRFFRDCGFKVVVSGETNRQTVLRGLDSVVAEPCFPIIVAHGHVAELKDKAVDYIWLPNIVSSETRFKETESYVCPWGQTLPFIIRQVPQLRDWADKILCPTIRRREGKKHQRDVMTDVVQKLGVSKAKAHAAFDRAVTVQKTFEDSYVQAGREALATLRHAGESGIVVVGRPYNIHDAGVSLSAARKLRDFYGVNVIPIDSLPLADVDIRDVNNNMYWEYGRRILAAGKLVRDYPNLHIVYITNFKCGPDSYVKSFLREASGKPFLTLQFDGHSNDAGTLTRCEAYLDSKGIMRWWRKSEKESTVSKVERSTSRECRMPVLD